MYKKLILILVIVGALALFLAGCQRSASTALLPTVTATGNAAGVTDPMQLLKALATQTALAEAGLPINGTPTPDLTGTPTAGETDTTPADVSPTPTSLLPPTGTPETSITATTQVVITVTPPTLPRTYTLHEGEFPYCIARRFNIDPDTLLSLNGLTEGQMYSPGLVLTIPQTAGPFPSPRYLIKHPATYTVQANDTIYSIACKYGDVDPLAIAAVNSLTSPYTLTIGQSLSIP